jgi:uncharacterized protein (DUF736 family)
MTSTTTTKPQFFEWKKKELGCAWKRESNKGESYISGTLNLKNIPGFPDQDVAFIGFKNKDKQKDTHPDIRIYISEKRDAPAPTAKASTAPSRPAPSVPVPTATDESANELI